MSKQIFRQVALERLSSPEQLDLLLQVTTPKSWLTLLGLIVLLIMAVVWSFMGTIPTEISAPTVLLNAGGVKNIVSVYNGQVTELYVNVGDVIKEDQPIVEIVPLGQAESLTLTSPYTGARILELKVGVGSLITQGQNLTSLEFVGDNIELEAFMYLSPIDGKSVEPGMTVRISPNTARVEEFGYLLGEVTTIGEFPSSHQGLLLTLGSEGLIEALVTEETPIEVQVKLLPDPTMPSGYKWSLSKGPNFKVDSGTLGVAIITTNQQPPINLILP